MIICTAITKDAELISRLCSNLTISRSSDAITGFVEYPQLSITDWSERIRGNKHFYVAFENIDLSGFFASYQSDRLPFRDSLANSILEKEKQFIYCDVMGVKAEYRKTGLGKRFIEHLFANSHGPYWAATVCAPHRNRPVEALLWLTGWEPKEMQEVDGLRFQLYRHE